MNPLGGHFVLERRLQISNEIHIRVKSVKQRSAFTCPVHFAGIESLQQWLQRTELVNRSAEILALYGVKRERHFDTSEILRSRNFHRYAMTVFLELSPARIEYE